MSVAKILLEQDQYLTGYFKVLTEDIAKKTGLEVMSLDDFFQDQKEKGKLKKVKESVVEDTDDLLKHSQGDVDIKKMASSDEREKQLKKPIAARTNRLLHNSTIKGLLDDKGNEIDDAGLAKLKAIMTKRPKGLLKQNDKMKKSRGTGRELVNFSLPAYQGLFFNEKTDTFQVVRTCPSASECVAFCYATKGGYIQWKASAESASSIITFLMNDFKGFFQLLAKDITRAAKGATKRGDKLVVRIHDAGDFFSEEYIRAWKQIMEKFTDVEFYAYTKQHQMLKQVMGELPSNFTLNLSFGGRDDKEIDVGKDKHSRVIPKELFADLKFQEKPKGDGETKKALSPEDLDTLKKRIAEKLNIDYSTILSYEEMLDKKEGNELYWNVIVTPEDGDISATRKDVLGTLLFISLIMVLMTLR